MSLHCILSLLFEFEFPRVRFSFSYDNIFSVPVTHNNLNVPCCSSSPPFFYLNIRSNLVLQIKIKLGVGEGLGDKEDKMAESKSTVCV